MKLNWMMVMCVSVFTATAIMFFGPAPDVSVPAFQSQIAQMNAPDIADIAPAAGDTAEPAVPAVCDSFQSYVGKHKDELLQTDVEKAGLTLRLSPENGPLTEDIKFHRLTVIYDTANIITKIGCY